MKHLLVMLVAGLATCGVALAGSAANVPPGGNAPSPLIANWKTTLPAGAYAKAPLPAHMPSTRSWILIIRNSGTGPYPRMLGLRPADQGGPPVPFGVQGHTINLECLSENELPAKGHDTYSWSVRAGALHFRLVRAGCKSGDDRNNGFVLTTGVWRHG